MLPPVTFTGTMTIRSGHCFVAVVHLVAVFSHRCCPSQSLLSIRPQNLKSKNPEWFNFSEVSKLGISSLHRPQDKVSGSRVVKSYRQQTLSGFASQGETYKTIMDKVEVG